MSDAGWIERAQSAEAKLSTMKQTMDAAIERVKLFKANFGIRENSSGEISIDFDAFSKRLGKEQALALKSVIEETYR
jgi:hypothetical protein